jgi:hypothetical protein
VTTTRVPNNAAIIHQQTNNLKNEHLSKMSDFNSDSRGKRPDSLGSIDSETLTTDAGEHGWRKGPAKKPSPLESILQDEGSLRDEPSAPSQEFAFPPRRHHDDDDDDDDEDSPRPATMDNSTLESSAAASTHQDEFAEIASQNLKDHFGRLQGRNSMEPRLNMSMVSCSWSL